MARFSTSLYWGVNTFLRTTLNLLLTAPWTVTQALELFSIAFFSCFPFCDLHHSFNLYSFTVTQSICYSHLRHFSFQIPTFHPHILSVKLPPANQIFAFGWEQSVLTTKTIWHVQPCISKPINFIFNSIWILLTSVSSPICLYSFHHLFLNSDRTQNNGETEKS